MANEKYSLLDTDFISKMHLIRKDDHNKLIDKIMAMPGYCFYCHKQIQVEIMRHNIACLLYTSSGVTRTLISTKRSLYFLLALRRASVKPL